MPFFTLPLGFRVIFENPNFITCYGPIKKIWFSFEPFKHFCYTSIEHLFLSSFNFLERLCTQFFHFQILCNNLVDSTFFNIKFIDDHSNFQTLILTNENPHTVNVCACSRRGVGSRSRVIFQRFLPIYRVFVPPKYFST
jgi:hypothetical protein